MTHPTTPAADSSRMDDARRLGAAGLVLLAPVAVAIAWLALGADLPRRLATHWGFGDRPDGFDAATPFLVVATAIVGLIAVAGALVITRARSLGAVRPAAAVIGFLAWVLASATISVLVANHGLSDPHRARSGWPASLAVIAVAAGLALIIATLAPEVVRKVPVPVHEPGYTLQPGERLTWVGVSSSRRFLVAAGVVGVAGAVVLAISPGWAACLLVLSALVAWMHALTVRVDDAGVRAHFGPLPWPALRVPLDRIEAAEARDIDPMKWGGWGFRLSRRGTALVVRRGPGLVLVRRGRSDLAITVDHAEEAAEAVNALLARSRQET